MKNQYIAIMPAYNNNEMEYIGQIIESVLAQVLRPHGWVIVDHGLSASFVLLYMRQQE